jgi:hypothetical protein
MYSTIVIFLTVVHPKLNNNVIKLVICIRPQDKIKDSRNPQISAPLSAKPQIWVAHLGHKTSDFAICEFVDRWRQKMDG